MVTRLRVLRVGTGLNLKQFAESCDLNSARLCRVERAVEYVPPTWRQKLAEALGVEVEEICDSNGWPRLHEQKSSPVRATRKALVNAG